MLNAQRSQRSKELTDAFHGIVESLSISSRIKVRSISYCASEHLEEEYNMTILMLCYTVKSRWLEQKKNQVLMSTA